MFSQDLFNDNDVVSPQKSNDKKPLEKLFGSIEQLTNLVNLEKSEWPESNQLGELLQLFVQELTPSNAPHNIFYRNKIRNKEINVEQYNKNLSNGFNMLIGKIIEHGNNGYKLLESAIESLTFRTCQSLPEFLQIDNIENRRKFHDSYFPAVPSRSLYNFAWWYFWIEVPNNNDHEKDCFIIDSILIEMIKTMAILVESIPKLQSDTVTSVMKFIAQLVIVSKNYTITNNVAEMTTSLLDEILKKSDSPLTGKAFFYFVLIKNSYEKIDQQTFLFLKEPKIELLTPNIVKKILAINPKFIKLEFFLENKKISFSSISEEFELYQDYASNPTADIQIILDYLPKIKLEKVSLENILITVMKNTNSNDNALKIITFFVINSYPLPSNLLSVYYSRSKKDDNVTASIKKLLKLTPEEELMQACTVQYNEEIKAILETNNKLNVSLVHLNIYLNNATSCNSNITKLMLEKIPSTCLNSNKIESNLKKICEIEDLSPECLILFISKMSNNDLINVNIPSTIYKICSILKKYLNEKNPDFKYVYWFFCNIFLKYEGFSHTVKEKILENAFLALSKSKFLDDCLKSTQIISHMSENEFKSRVNNTKFNSLFKKVIELKHKEFIQNNLDFFKFVPARMFFEQKDLGALFYFIENHIEKINIPEIIGYIKNKNLFLSVIKEIEFKFLRDQNQNITTFLLRKELILLRNDEENKYVPKQFNDVNLEFLNKLSENNLSIEEVYKTFSKQRRLDIFDACVKSFCTKYELPFKLLKIELQLQNNDYVNFTKRFERFISNKNNIKENSFENLQMHFENFLSFLIEEQKIYSVLEELKENDCANFSKFLFVGTNTFEIFKNFVIKNFSRLNKTQMKFIYKLTGDEPEKFKGLFENVYENTKDLNARIQILENFSDLPFSDSINNESNFIFSNFNDLKNRLDSTGIQALAQSLFRRYCIKCPKSSTFRFSSATDERHFLFKELLLNVSDAVVWNIYSIALRNTRDNIPLLQYLFEHRKEAIEKKLSDFSNCFVDFGFGTRFESNQHPICYLMQKNDPRNENKDLAILLLLKHTKNINESFIQETLRMQCCDLFTKITDTQNNKKGLFVMLKFLNPENIVKFFASLSNNNDQIVKKFKLDAIEKLLSKNPGCNDAKAIRYALFNDLCESKSMTSASDFPVTFKFLTEESKNTINTFFMCKKRKGDILKISNEIMCRISEHVNSFEEQDAYNKQALKK